MGLPTRIGLTKREDNIVISTVEPLFWAWYGKYETAISIDGEAWNIAEGYETAKQAVKGHEKYENMSKEELMNLEFIG